MWPSLKLFQQNIRTKTSTPPPPPWKKITNTYYIIPLALITYTLIPLNLSHPCPCPPPHLPPQLTCSCSSPPSWAPRRRGPTPSLCRASWRSAWSVWSRAAAAASSSSCPSPWWVLGNGRWLPGRGKETGRRREPKQVEIRRGGSLPHNVVPSH